MSQDIKKAFAEVYQLLVENENCKVKTVLPQLVELMSKKSSGGSNGKTFLTNDKGKVTHVFCYYHKKWEDVTIAEYGTKKSTATGLNTMCKEGVSQWTKQQREKKQANELIVEKVMNGELKPEDIADEKAKIEEQAKRIEPRSDEHGFDDMPN